MIVIEIIYAPQGHMPGMTSIFIGQGKTVFDFTNTRRLRLTKIGVPQAHPWPGRQFCNADYPGRAGC
jgi:hypothetical protein